MTSPSHSQFWRFDNRPEANINDSTFSLQQRELPPLEEGQLLVKNLILSMDATNRLWLGEREELYMEPISLGDSMRGFGLCQIVKSNSRLYQEGQLVSSLTEWAEYSILDANAVQAFVAPKDMPDAMSSGLQAAMPSAGI